MEDWISYIILAIVQGLTEFLPVSSSGHLALMNAIFPFDAGIFFDLLLHVATLVSVCAFYFKDICKLVVGGCSEIGDVVHSKPAPRPNLLMIGYLLAATVITAVLGFAVDDYMDALRKPHIVGIFLIITSIILLFSKKAGALRTCDGKMNLKTALIIGLVQGFAVLPGISRSGSTITASLLLGVEAKDCARFSFLLSIPVIAGGFILEVSKVDNFNSDLLPIFIISSIVAAGVGYASLVVLESLLKRAKFYHFAPYCFLAGIVGIVMHFCFGL